MLVYHFLISSRMMQKEQFPANAGDCFLRKKLQKHLANTNIL